MGDCFYYKLGGLLLCDSATSTRYKQYGVFDRISGAGSSNVNAIFIYEYVAESAKI